MEENMSLGFIMSRDGMTVDIINLNELGKSSKFVAEKLLRNVVGEDIGSIHLYSCSGYIIYGCSRYNEEICRFFNNPKAIDPVWFNGYAVGLFTDGNGRVLNMTEMGAVAYNDVVKMYHKYNNAKCRLSDALIEYIMETKYR